MKNDHVRRETRGSTRSLAAVMASLCALIAGCGSAQPTHYYTLMPTHAAGETAASTPRLDWGVGTVGVPQQVDQPQWVVRTADGSLVVLENERWIAPLGDEIRGAVVERLTRTFGPPDAGPSAGGSQAWRIRIDVQRFDLLPNREARLEADWSLRGEGTALRCHAAIAQSVSSLDFGALARAQQQAVARLADAIGKALEMSGKGTAAGC